VEEKWAHNCCRAGTCCRLERDFKAASVRPLLSCGAASEGFVSRGRRNGHLGAHSSGATLANCSGHCWPVMLPDFSLLMLQLNGGRGALACRVCV